MSNVFQEIGMPNKLYGFICEIWGDIIFYTKLINLMIKCFRELLCRNRVLENESNTGVKYFLTELLCEFSDIHIASCHLFGLIDVVLRSLHIDAPQYFCGINGLL